MSTVPRDIARAYLERTLREVREFRRSLAFDPAHQSGNRYPPFAVLFVKSVPTAYSARVGSREEIKHQGAYDDLAFCGWRRRRPDFCRYVAAGTSGH